MKKVMNYTEIVYIYIYIYIYIVYSYKKMTPDIINFLKRTTKSEIHVEYKYLK